MNFDFLRNKKVLITGHTGFKGIWLSLICNKFGAKVIGVSKDYNNKIFYKKISNLNFKNYIFDIRNKEKIAKVLNSHKPDFIFHLAAQALVFESYSNPYETFHNNFISSLNILEVCRKINFKTNFIFITSDKSYENIEKKAGYKENDKIGGNDPYSGSKSSIEMLINSYQKSFFNSNYSKVRLAIARAGNVIGGGDMSDNRIIPDAFKCWSKNNKLLIRNPYSTRPWQFVLEPLFGYIFLAKNLDSKKYIGEVFNFGPKFKKHISTLSLIDKLNTYSIEFTKKKSYFFKKVKKNNLKESTLLQLDSSKAKIKLNWQCVLSIDKTLMYCAEWYINFYTKKIDLLTFSLMQIDNYINEFKKS